MSLVVAVVTVFLTSTTTKNPKNIASAFTFVSFSSTKTTKSTRPLLPGGTTLSSRNHHCLSRTRQNSGTVQCWLSKDDNNNNNNNMNDDNNNEWTSDFDDFETDGDSSSMFFSLNDFEQGERQQQQEEKETIQNKKDDLPDFDDEYSSSYIDDDDDSMFTFPQESLFFGDSSGCQNRQFSLGEDFVIDSFAGKMGFDEVTDWEYYAQDEDTGERKSVQPPPLDPSKPKRTRERVGSVVRIFRGEFTGVLASALRAQGLDKRLLIKEFSGQLALDLAKAEMKSIGRIQSNLCALNSQQAKDGEWAKTASGRAGGMQRQDNANLVKLVSLLSETPYLGILGEVNLAELEDDMDPNEWYRALGVPGPKPGSVWVVYEYAGLSTAAQYARPALARLSSMPLQRGIFGNPLPPPSLPQWRDRANYVVKGIFKQALEAVADLHDEGIAHRSIGRTSIILSSVGADKTEASSPTATVVSRLKVKLADFGFSGSFEESTLDPAFCSRARGFGMSIREGEQSAAANAFAMAEDLHALGFVFLGLILTSLAETPTPEFKIPDTDDDTLQRQLGDIFNNDMDEFRDYADAEDVWSSTVKLLDQQNGAGWELLRTLCFARERAAEVGSKEEDYLQMPTARSLLSSPFLN